MKRKILLAIVAISILGVAGVAAVLAQGPKPHQPAVPSAGADRGFTYQGQLKKDGTPVNGPCSMTFSLWDAPSSGSIVGGGQLVPLVTVTNGIFTVLLNEGGQFGVTAFRGDARWLQADVKCGADLISTTLSRQPVKASPYALSLVPGAVIIGSVYPALTVRSTFTSANAIEAYAENGANAWGVLASGSGRGVVGESMDGHGIHGYSGGSGTGSAVYAEGNNNDAAPNAALTLDGGAFRVINTTVSPAFVWTVGVVTGTCSEMSHPLIDGIFNVILIVTPRQDTFTIPATDVWVFWIVGPKWELCSPTLATGMKYNILVISR